MAGRGGGVKWLFDGLISVRIKFGRTPKIGRPRAEFVNASGGNRLEEGAKMMAVSPGREED